MNLEFSLGLKLLKELSKDEKSNFIFSSLSLGITFAMLAASLEM